jgi:hypothetical protein
MLPGAWVDGIVQVGNYSEDALMTPAARSITKVKQALVQYGAVAVAVHAGADWHSYTGGVLKWVLALTLGAVVT